MNNSDYVARVSNADSLQLVIITYELLEKSIKEAIACDDGDNANVKLEKGRKFLNELIKALDMKYDISKQLMAIYIYVNKLIITAEHKYRNNKSEEAKASLYEAIKILDTLLTGWNEAAKINRPHSGEILMDNAQQLFAGLTYKNGKLAEYVDDDARRGFKA